MPFLHSSAVSPKVETSSDAVPSHALTPFPDNHSCTSLASVSGLGSPGLAHHANPFTPPPGTPTISPSNPFFTRLQCNPFFVDLLGDHALKSTPPAPCVSSSPLWPPTVSSTWSDPSPAQDCLEAEPGHDVGVAREKSQLGVLGTRARASPNPFFMSSVPKNPSEWDESFEAFAASRLGLRNGPAQPAHTMTLPLEPTIGQTLEGSRMIDKMGAEISPKILRRPTKIPVFQGHQSQRFDWTQDPGINTDLLPPQIDVMSWECSKEEVGGHAPIQSLEDKTGISLFSEWDPEKPLDYSVSSPQFVNMSSLIPKSTSAGQPITSPFSKDFGETSGSDVGQGGVKTLAEQEDCRGPEGVGGENNFTWNDPPVFGEEAMYKTVSSPDEVASEASKIFTYEPEVSLVGTNPFFTIMPLYKSSETLLEGLESTTTDPLKPMYDAATEQTSTNTNFDLPDVTTHAAHENLHETYAPIFDSASSVLPNTDTTSSLSVMIANNTEINNNSTNEMEFEEEQSRATTKAQDTISQKLSMVLLADTTFDSTLEAGTITLHAPGCDSDFITLATDSEDAHQENCEENPDLNVEHSSSTSAEVNGSNLSEYLEAREPGPAVSPVPDALNFVTAIEEPDPGNSWGSLDALSAETGIKHLPLKSNACETAALPEEGGFATSLFGPADSSTATHKSVQLEEPHSDSNESLLPPPKPLRLFQDSVLNEQHMKEYHYPRLEDEAKCNNSSTPKDSSSDLFQTPNVSSGHALQLTSPSPFPSDYSAPKVGWENTGAKGQNKTFTVMEDELSSQKEVPQSFSVFDLEKNSDQSWLTSKSYFKAKELDTSHFAVWSADEENAIETKSTSLDKAILMEDSTEREPAQVLDVGTQPNISTGSCSPSPKLNEGLGESYLDQLKGTKQQSFEPTWKSLPFLSELCSNISQDFVRNLAPEDLHNQQTLRKNPLDPVPFPQQQPSKPFSGSDIISFPKGIGSAVKPKEELHAEAATTLSSHPTIVVNPKSSLFLHDCNPQASSTPSLLAETNAQVDLFPSPILPLLPSRPTTGTTSIAPPSKPPAKIDTPFMLLPQDTQSADGLPSRQQSR